MQNNILKKLRLDWAIYGLLALALFFLSLVVFTQFNAKRELFFTNLAESSEFHIGTYNKVFDVWMSEKTAMLDYAIRAEFGHIVEPCDTAVCVEQSASKIAANLRYYHNLVSSVSIAALPASERDTAITRSNRVRLTIASNSDHILPGHHKNTLALTYRALVSARDTDFVLTSTVSASEAIYQLYTNALDRNIVELVVYDHQGNISDLLSNQLALVSSKVNWRLQSKEYRTHKESAVNVRALVHNLVSENHRGRVLKSNTDDSDHLIVWSDDTNVGFGILAIFDLAEASSIFRFATMTFWGMLILTASVCTALYAVLYNVRRAYYLKTQDYLEELQQKVESRTESLYSMQEHLHNKNDELRRIAETDSLTGVANRSSFFKTANEIWASNETQNACIMMLDVDNFKIINDTYGHVVGDACLADVTQIIERFAVRTPYFKCFGRYGGEEFILLCTNTSLPGVYNLSESIRAAIAEHTIYITHCEKEVALKVTVCIGIATTLKPQSTAIHSVIDQADKAMYRGKKSGKNKVIMHENRIQELQVNA